MFHSLWLRSHALPVLNPVQTKIRQTEGKANIHMITDIIHIIPPFVNAYHPIVLLVNASNNPHCT